MIKCELCNTEFEKYNSLSKHLRYCKFNTDNLTPEEYYIKFMNPNVILYCPECSKKGIQTRLKFISMEEGFRKLCKDCNIHSDERKRLAKEGLEKNGGAGFANKLTYEKYKNTLLEKYGVDNPSLIEDSVKKRTDTRNKNRSTINKNISISLKNSEQLKIGRIQFKKTCLEKYGVDNPSKSPEVQDKIKTTFDEKYGGHPMSTNEIKEKVKSTSLKKYGVENPSSSQEIIDKIINTNLERYGVKSTLQTESVQNKTKITNIEKYGVEHYSQTAESKNSLIERNKNVVLSYIDEYLSEHNTELLCDYTNATDILIFKCKECGHIYKTSWFNYRARAHKCPQCNLTKFGKSKLQTEVSDFVKSLNLDVVECDRNVLNDGSELDIYIPSKNVAIEFNGLYWHSEGILLNRYYHEKKSALALEKGIFLIHIFEDEWIYKQDIVKSIIKSKLGIYNQKIYARKCEIINLTPHTMGARLFLDENHIQSAMTGINIGLVDPDNQLVALSTFGKSRFNKEYEYELLRFCSLMNTQVIGGFSKTLKYFINNYNPKSIITYADVRYSKGGLYKSSGFEYIHKSDPNYFYIINGKRESRNKYQKHKLPGLLEKFDPTLTEYENMITNGIDRIWDCGNYVYAMKF